MKQRIEITFEQVETIVLRQSAAIRSANCAYCGSEVAVTTPLIASFLFETGEREIFRMIEDESIHIVDVVPVSICLRSLISYFDKESPVFTAA